MSKKMLKRSLALGALMAFVITGSVTNVEAATYQPANGSDKTITGNIYEYKDYITGHGERVLGGYNVVPDNVVNSNIIVSGGRFNYIVGGNWNQTKGTASTRVVIDGATAKQVYAGSAFSVSTTTKPNGEVGWVEDFAQNRTTNLTIYDGTFGGEVDNTDCPEMVVSGGDFLKIWASSSIPTYDKVRGSLESSNIKIEDGTFYAAIIGGSAAVRTYADSGDGSTVNATVKEANIEITGGTFHDAIVAGGLAWGHQTESVVEKAVLNIIGTGEKTLEFESKADIYAGGLIDGYGYNERSDHQYGENGEEKDGSIVNQTVINIVNTDVNNIYGTDGYITYTELGEEYVMTHDNSVYGAKRDWTYSQYRGQNKAQAVNTTLKLTNVTAEIVDIPLGSVTLGVAEEGNTNITTLSLGDKVGLAVTVDGTTNDAIGGDTSKIANYITIENAKDNEEVAKKLAGQITTVTLEAGDATDKIILTSDGKGGFTKDIIANESNTGISDINSVALMSWRAETNDMNKRLGELRNANGEHGVWVRMVRGESEYNSVNHQYNQYQLGYDEKLSVDPSWTIGAAYTYTDAESSFSKGSGENTHKGLAIYGSKLNDDGSFIDLIAKYSRLEHDFDLGNAKGDYSTNGYSVSAEYGKRLQQGNGLWIEPQIELTYGKISSAEYMVGKRNIIQDGIESLVGRVGFSLGKDINQGNVYARASYLYDFDGETEARFAAGRSDQAFEQDLGGGWWEVGVGANINLSKATYIYADVEKTFGGEVDTNWQWNLGVRYSF